MKWGKPQARTDAVSGQEGGSGDGRATDGRRPRLASRTTEVTGEWWGEWWRLNGEEWRAMREVKAIDWKAADDATSIYEYEGVKYQWLYDITVDATSPVS